MKRTTHLPLVAFVALSVACSGKSEDSSGGKTGTTNDSGSTGTTDDTIEAVYPTDAMDRALLYYGHGGYGPESDKGNFEDFDTHIKDTFGWNTDHREDWTEDLAAYRMVGLVALGHNGDENLTAPQIEGLRTALANGTRIVFFADRESCGSTVMADALSQLGATMGYTGEAAGLSSRVDATDLGAHQLTDGLSKVIFKEPCWVNSTGGSRVVNHIDYVVAAAQRPATGGDIVVIGDFQAIDNSGYLTDDSSDNLTFAERLVLVDPAL